MIGLSLHLQYMFTIAICYIFLNDWIFEKHLAISVNQKTLSVLSDS